jgi:hypothetical protein
VSVGIRVSTSESSLVVEVQAHARSPQSGHLFHDRLFVWAVTVATLRNVSTPLFGGVR